MLSKPKINKVISYLFQDYKDYQPVGNHELGRHLVYHVSCEKGDYILKMYFVNDRWNREVGMLKKLDHHSSMIPLVRDYGIINDAKISIEPIKYLVYHWQPGILMMDNEESIDSQNLKSLYFNMGLELAKIHSCVSLTECGILSETGQYKTRFQSNKEYFLFEVERIFRNLEKCCHDKQDLIKRAKSELLLEIADTDWNIKSVYCHNDFGPRNILIDKVNNTYKLTGVIDFEQSSVSDGDREVIILYNRIKKQNKKHSEDFIKGYQSFRSINIHKKEQMYMLFNGLSICGWAKDLAPDYYEEGIKILEQYVEKSSTR